LGIAVVAFLLSRLAAVGIGEPLGAFAALPTTQPAQGSSIQPAQGSSIQPAQGSSIQPPQSAPSPSNIPTVSETQGALSGLVAIAKEADILVKMGAFVNPVNGDLEKVMSLMRYKVPSDLAGRMNAFDQAEADALAARAQVMPPGGGGPMPSSYVARGLNGLNEADLAALQSGKAISIPSTDYMYALDDLAIRAGRPPIDGVYSSNTAEVADLINTALAGGSSPSKSFQGGVPAQTSQLVGSSGISTADRIDFGTCFAHSRSGCIDTSAFRQSRQEGKWIICGN